MLQMLLDQDRPFERASGQFAVGIAIGVLRCGPLLLFHADQHFREQEAFQLLPGLPIFAHPHGAVQSQLPEPVTPLATTWPRIAHRRGPPLKVQTVPIVDPDPKVFRDLVQGFRRFERPIPPATAGLGGVRAGQGVLLVHDRHGGCAPEIRGIGAPFPFRDFDGDEAGQALLLPGAAQGRVFTADGDRRRRDRVFGQTRPWTA